MLKLELTPVGLKHPLVINQSGVGDKTACDCRHAIPACSCPVIETEARHVIPACNNMDKLS